MSKVVGITGSSGLIGSALSCKLALSGFEIKPLSRGFSQEDVDECDIIINLAGASINRRWTEKNRELILNSRIDTTKRLIEFLNRSANRRTTLLFSASATGIYPDSDGSENTPRYYDEYSTERGGNFLANVCERWEKEALETDGRIRVAIIRLGVVLTQKGGALPKMSLPFRWGIAGKIGNGLQPFSWVSPKDLTRAVEFIIKDESLKGVFNITSPIPVNNSQLTSALAGHYKSPVKVKIPLFLFNAVYGDSSILVTKGQYVLPKRLLERGFEFRIRNISDSLL